MITSIFYNQLGPGENKKGEGRYPFTFIAGNITRL
jgi:hypothetical protein